MIKVGKFIQFYSIGLLMLFCIGSYCFAEDKVNTPEPEAAVTDSHKSSEKKRDERIVAKTDAFVVTVGDVTDVAQYFNRKKFQSTREEYQKVAVQLRLFVEEGKALGWLREEDAKAETSEDSEAVEKDVESSKGEEVAGKEQKIISSNPSIEEIIASSDYFINKKLEEYPLDEMVVLSYYRAYPEVFGGKGLQDEKVRLEVARRILGYKKKDFSLKTFQALEKKYQVVYCDPQTGICQEETDGSEGESHAKKDS